MSTNLFCCYSIPLRDYLSELGFRYETCAIHPDTHKLMWIYIKNEKLNKVLKEWTANKPC